MASSDVDAAAPAPASAAPQPGRRRVDVLQDVADLAWGAVTVRITWTLISRGLRPDLVSDLRDHVFYLLPPETPAHVAEDRAELLTRAFIARARGQSLEEPWPDDWDVPPPLLWRVRLHKGAQGLSQRVLQEHYANELDLRKVASRLQEDLLAVEAAREGLREIVRTTALGDGQTLSGWTEPRLDRLLHRLAALGDDDAPPLHEVAEGRHPAWVEACPRCRRAWSLVQQGILTRAELIPPSGGGRPRATTRVLALQLQRDAASFRDALRQELPSPRLSIGEDTLLVPADDLDAIAATLRLATELERPDRTRLRGVVLEGPGRWCKSGLLGPLHETVLQGLRGATWGAVQGIGELAPPLPPLPSPGRARLVAAATAVVAIALVRLAVLSAPERPAYPLDADFVAARGGWWVDLDVDDRAYLGVVVSRDGALEVRRAGDAVTEKAPLAVGDGRYRFHEVADGVLVISSPHPLALPALIAQAEPGADPLGALQQRVQAVAGVTSERAGR
jgi:hypothetical protein